MEKTTIKKIKKIFDVGILIVVCLIIVQQLIRYEIGRAEQKYAAIKPCHNICSAFFYRSCKEISTQIAEKFIDQKVSLLKRGVDRRSSDILDCISKCMKKAFIKDYPIILTDYQKEHFQKFRKKLPERGKFPLDKNVSPKDYEYFPVEVAYFHHNLKFADQRIKNYIKNRDILDIGAYNGSSLVVLSKYTDKTVYCFEFSKKSIKEFNNLIQNRKALSAFKLIEKGVSDKEGHALTYDNGNGEDTITGSIVGTDLIDIELTTIDIEAKKNNMNVGFIKADVEGHAMNVVKGGIETIKAHRPVLCLSIYHNTEEFFDIKPFLEQNLENYVYEFLPENFFGCMSELALFCYPKEILN